MSTMPRIICQFNRLNPAKYHSPPPTHQTPEKRASVTSSSASSPKTVRRSQRRGWMSRGKTRRSLPHKNSSSQIPTIPCMAKMNHSCGRPLIRLIMPVVKARVAASAMLQSVSRGGIRDHPYVFVFILTSAVLLAKVVHQASKYITLCHKNDENVCFSFPIDVSLLLGTCHPTKKAAHICILSCLFLILNTWAKRSSTSRPFSRSVFQKVPQDLGQL